MSIILYRNTFLNAITDTSFPSDIRILSVEESSHLDGYTTVTVDRNLDWSDGDGLVIKNLGTYDGFHELKYVDNSNNKFDIKTTYVANASSDGILKETTHRYKDNINEVLNYPAILLAIDKTTFIPQNRQQFEAQYEYFFFVIDRLDNYGDEKSSETLELAQDFVDTKAIALLHSIGRSMNLEIDEIEPMEHVINDNEVVAAMGKLKINV